MATTYIGNWNGHSIRVENTMTTEKLFYDDQLISESGKGIKFGSALDGEMPDSGGMHCYVLLNGAAWPVPKCYAIIGIPVQGETDKKQQTFSCTYNGTEIRLENRKSTLLDRQCFLLINGEEVDKEDKGLHFVCILSGSPDENGKKIVGVLDGVTSLNPVFNVFAEAEVIEIDHFEGELISTQEAENESPA